MALTQREALEVSILLGTIRQAELTMQAGQGSENPDVQRRTHDAATRREENIRELWRAYYIAWPEF